MKNIAPILILCLLIACKNAPTVAELADKYAYEITSTNPVVVCIYTKRAIPIQVINKETNEQYTPGDEAKAFAENPLIISVSSQARYEVVVRFSPSAHPEGDLDSWILAQLAHARKKLGWNIEKYQNHSFGCPADSDTKTCKQENLTIKLKIDKELFFERMVGVEGVNMVTGSKLFPNDSELKEGHAQVTIGKLFTWEQVMPAVDKANSNGFF